jgi:hypothetical protein
MHSYVFEEIASFIFGIMLITLACQRRSHVYLKRLYTCTRLHGFKCCKCVKAAVSYRATLLRCACVKLTCYVFCDGRRNRYCLMLKSREAKRCVDGRRGEQWGGGGKTRIEPILNSVLSSLSCLFCTDVLCMPLETRTVEELIVMELLYE